MISKFLPTDFDKSAKIAILAGKGAYPSLLKDRLDAAGIPNALMAFEGETAPELWERFDGSQRACANVGQLGHLLKNLKKVGARYAIMAGQITPKKLFKGMKPDLKAILVLATLKRKNAETIFGAIADQLQKIGVDMLDARAFLDDSLAPKGFFCGANMKTFCPNTSNTQCTSPANAQDSTSDRAAWSRAERCLPSKLSRAPTQCSNAPRHSGQKTAFSQKP